MTVQMAPSLERYRLRHRIQVDDSGPLPVCATDGIRIHPTRVGGWVHDAPTITRLHRADVTAMLDRTHPIAPVADACYFCGRSVRDGLYTRIDFGTQGVRNICDTCSAKADDGQYVVVAR